MSAPFVDKEENNGTSRLLQSDIENASYRAISGKGEYAAIESPVPPTTSDKVFSLSTAILMYASWASMVVFAGYVFFNYIFTSVTGGRWAKAFPDIRSYPVSMVGIAAHFGGAFILSVLGFVQLLPAVRRAYPAVHRWAGRVSVVASIVTALGGLAFIVLHRTFGGLKMDLGFGICGSLMVWFGVETWRHARARRFEEHRAWALRLFVLIISSWMYRVEYDMARVALGKYYVQGATVRWWLASIMDFAFFIPNLILVEVLLHRRAQPQKMGTALNVVASVIFAGIAMYTLFGVEHIESERLARDLSVVLVGCSLSELEELLITADLGVDVVEQVLEDLRATGPTSERELKDALKVILPTLLRGKQRDRELAIAPIAKPPAIIMVIGSNGTGKTPTMGKLTAGLCGVAMPRWPQRRDAGAHMEESERRHSLRCANILRCIRGRGE